MQGLNILLQPNVFMQLTINGVAMGMIYALMAMGLILLIRAIGVMNFAQGELLMLGAFITWGLTYQVKLPFVLMIPAAMLCFAFVGVVFMFVAYWPLRTASYPTATVISTMGAAMVIREIATITWGSLPLVSAPLVKGVVRVGSLRLQYQYLLTIAIGAVLIFLVFVLFEKLYAGRIMQAAAQDKYAAELLGIPTVLTTAATYIIVVTLASVGGYMIAPVFLVNVTLGTLQLRAFAGVVTGGFGSVKGAIVGSLFIGLVESYSSTFTTTYKDAVVFLVLIVVLLFRPQGLFGERVADKA
ncbi:MAG: branched-chain amino acid ABC transporter permease [Synergistaceae bacterium]|jgi:branched-chain amino acid transport system permease protein|nr:branched-chain amino acid ABC transporter permease [Synergistaceae bacterium]